MSSHVLDLDWTMPNVEFEQPISLYYIQYVKGSNNLETLQIEHDNYTSSEPISVTEILNKYKITNTNMRSQHSF